MAEDFEQVLEGKVLTKVTYLPVDGYGTVSLDALDDTTFRAALAEVLASDDWKRPAFQQQGAVT